MEYIILLYIFNVLKDNIYHLLFKTVNWILLLLPLILLEPHLLHQLVVGFHTVENILTIAIRFNSSVHFCEFFYINVKCSAF